MLAELIRGIRRVGQSAPAGLRGDAFGALITMDGGGRYEEACLQNQLFSIDSDAVTLAAANTTKGALGTVKLINGFYNPAGNGFNALILAVHVTTVSGTPAGGFFHNYLTGVALSNAKTGTILARNLAGGAPSSMLPEVNVVLASNTPAATQAMVQLGSVGGPAAIAAGAGMADAFEETAGGILVPPGCVYGILGTGAGTSHVVQSTIVYREIPIG